MTDKTRCEYCGVELPVGVDKRTRRIRSAHFEQHAKERDRAEVERAALAEPVQEPVGYLWPTGRHPEFRFTQQERDGVSGTPVYLSPPQRLPLTDEEILRRVHTDVGGINPGYLDNSDWISFARAIEQAHGIGSKT